MIAQLKASAPRPLVVRILELLVRDEGGAWPLARGDSRLHVFLKEILVLPELRIEAGRLIRDLRLSAFMPDLARVAGERKRNVEERVSAIDTIRQFQSPAALGPLKILLGDPEIRVALAAARAIGALGTDEAYQSLSAILTDLSKSKAVRKELVRQLGASRGGALLILQMAEEGTLPQDLVLDAASVTNTSQHENVRLMAQRLLPLPASRSGRTLPPLPALLRMRGDIPRGRSAFFGRDGPQCARCHKIAREGRDVGPDLSRIGEKLARETLFESILNPS